MLGNRRYCYPLTITDFASRYLLTCEALSTTQEKFAFTVFERTFKEFGLPHTIRTDNGVPVASAHALYGLSKLSVWWLRLGIHIERIQPGHPQQNGRHERMHLTLKTEATKPAAANVLQQQARFDTFLERYNHGPAAPGPRDESSRRPLRAIAARLSGTRGADLPLSRPHDHRHPLRPDLLQRPEGESQPRLCRPERRVTQVGERIWLVTFMQYDLGYFDDETCRLEPIENPFGPKVLLVFNPSPQRSLLV